MAVIKCKMCGGDLNIAENSTVAICEYCGTQQTIPTADSEKKLTLFSRANRLRLACEFDKAANVYESIVAEFPTEAEAYWGLVLCRYGIEYVDDPATGKKVPTCHRSSFDSILEDSDFEQAQENADAVARKVYRNEAKAIESLRRGILDVSGKEEPYDIFICYKETAEDGQRTLDSVMAQDVYDVLTEKGYRVFFSRITLEDKLGTEYEPYIFAALNSSKVMLVFGTDYEYFNAVWVKNEWSRYLAMISAGQKKTLIPCYKGVDAYDMPKEFSRLQAQDMGKVGAIQDLLRGIDKIFNGSAAPTTSSASLEWQMQAQEQAKADNTVQLGTMALNSGDIQKAIQYYEEAIKINPDHIGAYLGLVRALDNDKSKPYCHKLETFAIESVLRYLKHSPEMLMASPVSLLDRAVSTLLPIEFIRVLLEAGADKSNEYIIYHAITSNRTDKYDLIKLLLDHSINPNVEYTLKFKDTTEICTPLRDVIWQIKDTKLMELLIDYGADVNYISKNNRGESWSLLDMAIRQNNEQMVQLLLEKGANPNSGRWCDRDIERYYSNLDFKVFYCALSEAILNAKNPKIVQMLLNCGADPNYRYIDYQVRRFGIQTYIEGYYVKSSLYEAVNIDNVVILEMLLSAGANPLSTYKHQHFPINGGMHSSSPESRPISIRDIPENSGELVLDYAKKWGSKEAAQLLEKAAQKVERVVKIEQLRNEQILLAEKLSSIVGVFASIKRRKIEMRLGEIKAELSKLEDFENGEIHN